jgi:hypothetical protein
MEKMKEEEIEILMRQTNYTKEECINKLMENDLLKCIEIYLNIPEKKEEKPISTNQAIYKSFRELY